MEHFQTIRQRPAALEVDLMAAFLLSVGLLLWAHAVLLPAALAWQPGLLGTLLCITGGGLWQRRSWARRLTLWLCLAALLGFVTGAWSVSDLLHGVDVLRGLSSEQGAQPLAPVMATDQALLVVFAYWLLGWCAWRLWARVTSRHFESQTALRRLRKSRRTHNKSPST